MAGRVADFLDTNVWVYAHTAGADDSKSDAARNLLGSVRDPVISAQVLSEYSAVMIRNRLPDAQVRENLDEMAAMCRTLPVSEDTVRQAWRIRTRYGFSFWDSQMIASALEAGCSQIYTEDLQAGQTIEGRLKILNPFRAQPG